MESVVIVGDPIVWLSELCEERECIKSSIAVLRDFLINNLSNPITL